MDENEGITRSIHMSSSLHFDSLADYRIAGQGQRVLPGQTVENVDNGYGLQGNPTIQKLQDSVSELENGTHTLLFPSGLSALTSVGALLSSGDHWLLPDSVYGPTRRYADFMHKHYGISCDYYDPTSINSVASLIKAETKLIHIETPVSVTFEETDVDGLVKLAKAKDILTSADNTWASGILYQPLAHGIDISILGLTKYPAGYSDVFMGSLTCKNLELFKRFSYYHRVFGYGVSPFSAMLVSRGLESLNVRMAAHGAKADQLTRVIANHPKISKIYRAGSKINGSLSGSNGLFSIELDRRYNDAELDKAFKTMETFKIGKSWGGTRSLILPFQPEELSNRFSPPQNTIIRFHSGLENIDLQRADITNFLEGFN
ncbi:PLP-dependent transferase [Candidatus Parcubacteria bacterium]|nr:PLP-dependent transferase [Candidatus Parcubacteria bacterium]